VLDLPRGPAAVAAAGEACDAVVVVTSSVDEELPAVSGARSVHHVVNLHPRRSGAMGPCNATSPYVLRHEPASRPFAGDPVGAARAIAALQPASHAARTLGRLTRKLLGVSVGIALGGGAAFGIAHVGILQALEEAGLPVDVVAGTSMGSIIAIAHAAGLSGDEMAAIAGRIGNVRTTLSVVDPTLSGAGLLNGRRLVRIFSPLLPIETFDELVTPCRVVAMDVETGERVDIGSGRLDHAFRASCSIPLVFTPVRDDEGRTLVDGGMIDPVPVDVARDMGADIVIGVNVVPKLERGVTTALSRVFKSVSRLNPLARFGGGGAGLPDLVDVLMNSLQVVEYELGEYKQLEAEVRVEVPLAEFTWIEFYRATEIIDRGREVGQVAVDGLRAELARRLA
jgi:predicted acylesterase/phospholipase RssA